MFEPRGVIFDLDGVLVSTDEYHYRAWKKLTDREGIYFDRRINDRLRGVSRRESLEIILEASSRAYTEEEKLRMAEEKNDMYRRLLRKLTRDDILPGVLNVLEKLRNRGARLAVGSSSKNAPMILERIGLADCFDAVVDGNQISRTKPDPEVFLLAAERLNLPPLQCSVVEDAVPGILAAAAAGMTPIAVGAAQGCDAAKYGFPGLKDADVDVLLGEQTILSLQIKSQ